MSEVLTIAMAGFGLASLIVIPANGPAAVIRERMFRPAWVSARKALRGRLRLSAKGPHDCVLCLTPYATAACWGIRRAIEGGVGELLLAVFAAAGIAAGAMVLAGFARPSPARSARVRKKGCRTCGRASVEGSSTTAQ